MSITRRNAPRFFGASEVQECAIAIATLAYRLSPQVFKRLYIAHERENAPSASSYDQI